MSEGAPSLLFNGTLSTLNAMGSVWLFALVILITADALGRTFFHAPIDGVNEMIELSLVGIVFLQLADATRKGRLTRSDGCFKLLTVKFPSIARALGVFFEFCGIVLMAIILYGSVPLLLESIEGEHYVGNIGIFTAPVWPIKLVIIIGCLATLLQFFVFMMRFIRGDKNCKADVKTDMETSGERGEP